MPWRRRVIIGGACLAGVVAAGYVGYVNWQQSVVDRMLEDLKSPGSPVPGVRIEARELERNFSSRKLEVVFKIRGYPEMPLKGECVWRLGMAPSLIVRNFRTTPELQEFIDLAKPLMTMDFGLPFMPKNLRVSWHDAQSANRRIVGGEALTTFRVERKKPVEKDGRMVYPASASGVPYHMLPVEGDWAFTAFVFRVNWAGDHFLYRYLPDDDEPILLRSETGGLSLADAGLLEPEDDVKLGKQVTRLSVRKLNSGWGFDFSHDGELKSAPPVLSPVSALKYWHVIGSVTAPKDVWLPEITGLLAAGDDVCAVPGICRPDAPRGLDPLQEAAENGTLNLKLQNFELDFVDLDVRAKGAMGVKKDSNSIADFDVKVSKQKLDEETRKTRPDVARVHDFVQALIEQKALVCGRRDECTSRVSVEPDDTGCYAVKVNGVDMTEWVSQILFMDPLAVPE